MLFTVESVLSSHCVEKGKVFTAKSIDFQRKFSAKPCEKYVENVIIFYFMLQMCFLRLVAKESVWERFCGPTGS